MDGRVGHKKQNFIDFKFCDSDKKKSYTYCKSQNHYYQQQSTSGDFSQIYIIAH